MIQKFSMKHHFKGPWDGCGKRVNKHAWDCELENNRCGAAFQCYLKCREYFSTKGNNASWDKYEESGDTRLIEKTTFKQDGVHIGFVSESFHEHNQLISDGYDNIACTDRAKVIDDVQAVPDAPNFYEVSNQINDPIDILRLQSFQLPCSCSKYREGTTCSFWSIRNSATHNLKKKTIFAGSFWSNSVRLEIS